jgi:two-component system nitrate/nitrite response regulator NarL
MKRILIVEPGEVPSPIELKMADAVLTSQMTDDQLLIVIRLVRKGEKILPKSFLDQLLVKPELAPIIKHLLSPREREIALLLKNEGGSNKVLAHRLQITEATVKVHLKSMLKKLGISNRTQIAMWAASQEDQEATAQEGTMR